MDYEHLADEIERLADDFASTDVESPSRAEAWNLLADLCQTKAADIALALRTLANVEAVQNARLDELYASINALGGYVAPDDIRGQAANETIGEALKLIEEVGGSDCLPLAIQVRHLEKRLADLEPETSGPAPR